MDKAGIYIHIPFCRRKCGYCDFYLVTNLSVISKFVDNLINEIKLSSVSYKDIEFDTVFFGGGTPSLLSTDSLSRILIALKESYEISGDAEITIESNPEDFYNDTGKPAILRDMGFNRISLGVQSLVDEELKFLTREHDSSMAVKVIENLLNYFYNLSVDVIYSLPGQNRPAVGKTIDKLLVLEVPHVSAYTLIFEPNTVFNKFKRKNLIHPNDDFQEALLYDFISDKLTGAGYNHYEVSNYALPGFESRHNIKYWDYIDCVGFGPSAHSLFKGSRWNNTRNIITYNKLLQENLLPRENVKVLTVTEMQNEFIMCGLRGQGVDLNKYKILFGEDFSSVFKDKIGYYTGFGTAEITNERFRLTRKGYLLADEITLSFVL